MCFSFVIIAQFFAAVNSFFEFFVFLFLCGLGIEFQRKGTYEKSQKLMEKPRFSQHDIYLAIEVLSTQSYFIQSELYENSGKTMKHNDDCIMTAQTVSLKSKKQKVYTSTVQMGFIIDVDGITMAFSAFSGIVCILNRILQTQSTVINLKTRHYIEVLRCCQF